MTPPVTSTPVTPTYVFTHGFLGFERLGPTGFGLEYWRGLPALLHRLGVRHLFATVPPGGALAARAEALYGLLRQHDARNVVLIGHSMGGLDGRHLVHHLDDAGRVRCLITIATPHQGSSLAPWALARRRAPAARGPRHRSGGTRGPDPRGLPGAQRHPDRPAGGSLPLGDRCPTAGGAGGTALLAAAGGDGRRGSPRRHGLPHLGALGRGRGRGRGRPLRADRLGPDRAGLTAPDAASASTIWPCSSVCSSWAGKP